MSIPVAGECSCSVVVPVAPIVLNDDERSLLKLTNLANSRALPQWLVCRSQIVPACAEGETNKAIAERLKLNKAATMGKWQQRYREFGIEGLHEELRPDRPRNIIEDERVAEVINKALQMQLPGATH